MDKQKNTAEKKLDALLMKAPDRQAQILADANFDGVADTVNGSDKNTPQTLKTAARNIRTKCGYVIIAATELRDEISAALQKYEATPSPDSLRVAHANMVLLQLEAQIATASEIKQQMAAALLQNTASEILEAQANMTRAIRELKTWKGDGA